MVYPYPIGSDGSSSIADVGMGIGAIVTGIVKWHITDSELLLDRMPEAATPAMKLTL